MFQTCRISWQDVTRSDKYSELSYVVFSWSCTLIPRRLRARHHISAKDTFSIRLSDKVVYAFAHGRLFAFALAYNALCSFRTLLRVVRLTSISRLSLLPVLPLN